MTLWILFCRMNAQADTFFPFYVRDREQTERKEYLYERLELKEYPREFRIVITTSHQGRLKGIQYSGIM